MVFSFIYERQREKRILWVPRYIGPSLKKRGTKIIYVAIHSTCMCSSTQHQDRYFASVWRLPHGQPEGNVEI